MDEKFEAEKAEVLAMMEHGGWQVMMRWTEERLNEARKGMPFNMLTVEQLHFSRGVFATLMDLLSMEEKLRFVPAAEPVEFE